MIIDVTTGLFNASFGVMEQLWKELQSLWGQQNHGRIQQSGSGLFIEIVSLDGSASMDTYVTAKNLFHIWSCSEGSFVVSQ